MSWHLTWHFSSFVSLLKPVSVIHHMLLFRWLKHGRFLCFRQAELSTWGNSFRRIRSSLPSVNNNSADCWNPHPSAQSTSSNLISIDELFPSPWQPRPSKYQPLKFQTQSSTVWCSTDDNQRLTLYQAEGLQQAFVDQQDQEGNILKRCRFQGQDCGEYSRSHTHTVMEVDT